MMDLPPPQSAYVQDVRETNPFYKFIGEHQKGINTIGDSIASLVFGNYTEINTGKNSNMSLEGRIDIRTDTWKVHVSLYPEGYSVSIEKTTDYPNHFLKEGEIFSLRICKKGSIYRYEITFAYLYDIKTINFEDGNPQEPAINLNNSQLERFKTNYLDIKKVLETMEKTLKNYREHEKRRLPKKINPPHGKYYAEFRASKTPRIRNRVK